MFLKVRLAICMHIFLLCYSPVSCAASDRKTDNLIRDSRIPEPTAIESVNDFISHSNSGNREKPHTTLIRSGKIYVRLLTPLNSSFNMIGDDISAVVVGSENNGKEWIEPGTVLEGTIEGASKATYGQTDGSLTLRFYRAKNGDKQFDLFSGSDTDDGKIAPTQERLTTKKQRIRGILMTVTKIAIPAAIGTGGMSIAITSGAGAAIGLAFSEKGKRLQGAARGAWEGAGLNMLDPVVCKGRSVVLPEGTPLQLQLNEPIKAPEYHAQMACAANVFENRTNGDSVTQVSTHAELLQPQKSSLKSEDAENDVKSALNAVDKKISQKDLAGALIELENAERLYSDNETLKQKHNELYNLISGGRTF